MNFKKTLASSLVLSLGLTTMMASPATAKSLSELQNEQNSVKNSIEQKKAELNNKTAQKSETLAKMKEINDSINATEKKIASFSSQISDQQATIAETNAQIAETEKKLEKAQGDLNNRLVTIYKEGSVNYLEVLFQSENFSDFLTRFEYLAFISKRDKQLVDEVSAMKEELDTQKATLEQQLQSLNTLKAEEEGVKGILQEQQATQKSVYAELEKDEAAIRENIAIMQATSAEIGNQIVALQSQGQPQSGGGAYAPSTGPVQSTPAGGGVWPAPASRVITSYYGGRDYPIDGSYNFHLGLDIGAGYGTPVVAYQGGTVIIATYHWSYGNYVVVDHGNGLSTLYAHMSVLNVGAGTQVAAGQQVGAIGSTGSSTGPHLHFEVRINGATVNPAPYLGL